MKIGAERRDQNTGFEEIDVAKMIKHGGPQRGPKEPRKSSQGPVLGGSTTVAPTPGALGALVATTSLMPKCPT